MSYSDKQNFHLTAVSFDDTKHALYQVNTEMSVHLVQKSIRIRQLVFFLLLNLVN